MLVPTCTSIGQQRGINMTIFFSKSVGNFVDDTIWAKLPDDAVEVSDDEYKAFLEARNAGKVIMGDDAGKPYIADRPPPSNEELGIRIRRERNMKLQEITWRIDRYRSQTELGCTTTDDANAYTQLLVYAQALRDVPQQTTFPQSVVWPELTI